MQLSDSARTVEERPTALHRTQWIGTMGRDGLIFSLLSMPFVEKVDGYKAGADEVRPATSPQP